LELLYRRFDEYHEFDGDIDGLDLPWDPSRRDLIAKGEIDPNAKEIRQWQRVRARRSVESGWA
jgi:hypothetical protein